MANSGTRSGKSRSCLWADCAEPGSHPAFIPKAVTSNSHLKCVQEGCGQKATMPLWSRYLSLWNSVASVTTEEAERYFIRPSPPACYLIQDRETFPLGRTGAGHNPTKPHSCSSQGLLLMGSVRLSLQPRQLFCSFSTATDDQFSGKVAHKL